MRDSLIKSTRRKVPWHDCGSQWPVPQRSILCIEAKTRSASRLIRPVALETVIGQDRTHVTLKVNLSHLGLALISSTGRRNAHDKHNRTHQH